MKTFYYQIFNEKRRKVFFPISIFTLIYAILIYSGTLKLRDRNAFHCLLPEHLETSFIGKISTNPVKYRSSPYYHFEFSPEIALSRSMNSSCKGRIEVILSESVVESLFPHKLYSKSLRWTRGRGKIGVYEVGARLKISGKFSDVGKAFFVKRVEHLGFEHGIFGRLEKYRAVSRLKFREVMSYWGEAGYLFLALISGMKEYIPNKLYDAFGRAGLLHILALSGFHLAIFSSFVGTVLGKVIYRRHLYFYRFFAVCVFVWFSGFTPSLTRAFIFYIISFFYELTNERKRNALRTLSITFLFHVALIPSDVLKLSFELSYMALFGMIILKEMFQSSLSRFTPPFLSGPLSTSTSATLSTAPIVYSAFKRIAPIGIFSSVIVSPLITLFTYLAIISFFISSLFPSVSPIPKVILNGLYHLIETYIFYFAKFPMLEKSL